jgi:hypothetical protein
MNSRRIDFRSQFDKDKARFDMMFKVAMTFIMITFVVILLYWIIVGYLAVKVSSNVDFSQGIKPVIETLWCGKPGCM